MKDLVLQKYADLSQLLVGNYDLIINYFIILTEASIPGILYFILLKWEGRKRQPDTNLRYNVLLVLGIPLIPPMLIAWIWFGVKLLPDQFFGYYTPLYSIYLAMLPGIVYVTALKFSGFIRTTRVPWAMEKLILLLAVPLFPPMNLLWIHYPIRQFFHS